MQVQIHNPWVILAVLLIIVLIIALAVVWGGYTLGNIKLPGGIEIGLTPPVKNHAPYIVNITDRQEHKNSKWFLFKDIYFSDPDGDAYTVTYKLVSSSIDSSLIKVSNDEIQSSANEQKNQALVVGTWDCKYPNYTVTLEARILDRAGNQSEPKVITFTCP